MRLSDCFIELIAYTAMVIRPDGGGQAAFEQVEADIRRLIADSEAKCQQGVISSADYDLARFAVFAWIDETILIFQLGGKKPMAGGTTAAALLPYRRCRKAVFRTTEHHRSASAGCA
jgi:hypothetical protein